MSGRDALLRVAQEGPIRQIRAIEIFGDPVPVCDRPWPLVYKGEHVGNVTSAAWSPDFGTNVAIGMVKITHWTEGTDLDAITPLGPQPGQVWETFWL